MSRHRSSSSTGHRCIRTPYGDFEISWTVDFYYPGSRLRYPRRFRRLTNERGARRFCTRWRIALPEAVTPSR